VTLRVGQVVGLLLLIEAAAVTLGFRIHVHRRVGGLSGRLLAATGEIVETAALLTVGLLARGRL
jgi:hypothetical protein